MNSKQQRLVQRAHDFSVGPGVSWHRTALGSVFHGQAEDRILRISHEEEPDAFHLEFFNSDSQQADSIEVSRDDGDLFEVSRDIFLTAWTNAPSVTQTEAQDDTEMFVVVQFRTKSASFISVGYQLTSDLVLSSYAISHSDHIDRIDVRSVGADDARYQECEMLWRGERQGSHIVILRSLGQTRLEERPVQGISQRIRLSELDARGEWTANALYLGAGRQSILRLTGEYVCSARNKSEVILTLDASPFAICGGELDRQLILAGTPLFTDGRLAGVILTAASSPVGSRFRAVAFSSLASDPAFAELVGIKTVGSPGLMTALTELLNQNRTAASRLATQNENWASAYSGSDVTGLATAMVKTKVGEGMEALNNAHSDAVRSFEARDAKTLVKVASLLLPLAVVQQWGQEGRPAQAGLDVPAASELFAEAFAASLDGQPAQFAPVSEEWTPPKAAFRLDLPKNEGLLLNNEQVLEEAIGQWSEELLFKNDLKLIGRLPASTRSELMAKLLNDRMEWLAKSPDSGRRPYLVIDPKDERSPPADFLEQLKRVLPEVRIIELSGAQGLIEERRATYPLLDMLRRDTSND